MKESKKLQKEIRELLSQKQGITKRLKELRAKHSLVRLQENYKTGDLIEHYLSVVDKLHNRTDISRVLDIIGCYYEARLIIDKQTPTGEYIKIPFSYVIQKVK